jgi:3D (Asp-Asp-Asp) domain-containing protein
MASVYIATAYCLKGRTASGIMVKRGIVAADTRLHKLNSKIQISNVGSYSGIYLVADRGQKIKNNRIDIWMPSKHEAVVFGKRKVYVQNQ